MAINFGGLLAGAGVVGKAMRAEEEAQRVARQNQLNIEEQNRLDMLRQQQAKAPAPEAVTTGDLLNIGQQHPMDVETVVPAAPQNGVMTPDQARAAAQKRLQTTPQVAPVPGSAAAIPYGQQVENPVADQFAFQRATEAANLRRMKIQEYERRIEASQNPAERGRLQLALDAERRMLAANEQVIARNQPTVDYGREGRNQMIAQQQQAPGADATTAIRNVLGREGGFVNNPADRGGMTKYGISKAAYPNLDIANLTVDQAAAIYKRDYWDAIKADQLPPALREMAFDAAVNQGVAWTKTALEQSKGNPEVFLQLREQRYRDIVAANPSQQQFLNGWLNRIAEFRQTTATQVAAAPDAATAAQPIQVAQAPTDTATDVTAGTTGPIVPGPIASSATPGVKTAPQTKSPTAFYSGNPQSISGDQQILNGQYQRVRTEAMRKFQMAQQAGLGAQAEAIRDQIVQLDEGYKTNSRLLQAMNGVYQLQYANDPRGVSAAMSFYTGMPVAFQPRSDGTYNMWVNGQKVGQPMTRADVTDAARELFDAKYREAKITSQTKFGVFRAEEAVKLQGKLTEIQANMIKNTVVERVKGELRIKENALKEGWTAKPSGAGDGTIVLMPPVWMQQQGTPPLVYNPSGRTIEIDGNKVQSNSAIPITGLPSAVQIAGR